MSVGPVAPGPPVVLPAPDPDPPSTLGCGDWRAFLAFRGGQPLAEMGWTSLSMGRVLDEVSQATVTLAISPETSPPAASPELGTAVVVPASGDSGSGGGASGPVAFGPRVTSTGLLTANDLSACCFAAATAEPWVHELLLYRDGFLVWAGPVRQVSHTRDEVRVVARDLLSWFERRFIHNDLEHTNVDLATIFAQYAADALSVDESPNITVRVGPGGVTGTRKVLASSYVRAADVMRELLRTGLDITAVARELRAGNRRVPTGTLSTLVDDMLVDPELDIRGGSTVTRVAVLGGSTTGGVPVVGVAGAGGDTGVLEARFSEQDIQDSTSALRAAESRRALLSDNPRWLRSRLDPATPVLFEDLVPGAAVDVHAQVGCAQLADRFRLSEVAVDVDAAFDELVERVEVMLQPMGDV